ncbi:MAG: methionyl-tRNA formyltransferase, partial [Bacteroidetes bacterium]|nr:methionyl-tRNA formyltransferase [Bacteroidota bacterium]
ISPTPVKTAALRLGVDTILQPESVKESNFARDIRDLEPDIIVVVAFRILPPAVFTCASLGAFNLHGSLLPSYRGAAPIHRAVMAGENATGVTTFFLKEKVDTGHIILMRSMPIGPDETAGEVHDRMMHLGADVVLETVRKIESGSVETTVQNEEEATLAPKLFREDCRIRWSRRAFDVHNHIRGLSPFPGAWTMHGETMLKIFRSRIDRQAAEAELGAAVVPGSVLDGSNRFLVSCGEGTLEILEIQQEGRSRMTATEFLRGSDLAGGDRLG